MYTSGGNSITGPAGCYSCAGSTYSAGSNSDTTPTGYVSCTPPLASLFTTSTNTIST